MAIRTLYKFLAQKQNKKEDSPLTRLFSYCRILAKSSCCRFSSGVMHSPEPCNFLSQDTALTNPANSPQNQTANRDPTLQPFQQFSFLALGGFSDTTKMERERERRCSLSTNHLCTFTNRAHTLPATVALWGKLFTH